MLQAYAPTITAGKGYSTIMENKGFKALLQRAARLQGEGVHGLPPGQPVEIYPVDALPGCPEDWVRGQGSYVCPVHPEWGLWFDWTHNDGLNTAVMSSVKGMNPITGQKIEKLSPEKYNEKCPIHEEPFKTGLLCEKCGFKWPPQSYVAAPNTLWWDGFRQPDGNVRQFFFTADEERDVASAIIGKRNTVPAFGFAFFEPEVRRVAPVVQQRCSPVFGLDMSGSYSTPAVFKSALKPKGPWKKGGEYNPSEQYKKYLDGQGPIGVDGQDHGFFLKDHSENDVKHSDSPQITCQNAVPEMTYNCSVGGVLRSTSMEERPRGQMATVASPNPTTPAAVNQVDLQALMQKSVSVGAGAQISQDLRPDDLPGVWKSKPSALIRLYFVFQPQFENIFKKGGLKNLDGDKQGYLKGVKVG